uniref:Uncharacterized protein n=1 Tax=Anguilla anguilla TaxID=7936 RepID=A0A0E9PYI2_ANGAN
MLIGLTLYTTSGRGTEVHGKELETLFKDNRVHTAGSPDHV